MALPTTIRLTRAHPDFPMGAASMQRPPDQLNVKGRLPPRPAVAIVGTRAANDEALLFTTKLSSELARLGVSIWSGGARGVDAAAHRGALQAQGRTVVVMGTGMAQLYPADHRPLFEQVLDADGAWLTMLRDDQPGSKWTFLQRNELLAALVDAVIVVQAPVRSGARSTAAAARRMGRRLWVVPAAPWDPMGAGCLEELRAGAELLPRLSVLAQALGKRASKVDGAPGSGALPSDLSDAERAVALAVQRGSRHLDGICEKTGLSAQRVSSALLTLSLRHVLVLGSDGRAHPAT